MSPQKTYCFPIIDDENQDLVILLGMLDPAEKDEKGMPLTAHVVFVYGPNKKLKLSTLFPATIGRNIEEILRVAVSLQLTAEEGVAILVDCKDGDGGTILPAIPEEEAKNFSLKDSSPKDSHLARDISTTLSSLRSEKLRLSLLAQHSEPGDASCSSCFPAPVP
ncbi:Peroxiredoxin-6 [Fukomys damarensis]|uniref:Peroxiredoxin-6 n=1 Tax=Fukomys damarensis TaxID=885580 RepID=A0A091CKY1_FUKDA|nr:Peroxiredoxin-6 [Fukomys damarensis]